MQKKGKVMDLEKTRANDEIEIDLMEIITLLLKRLWIIILSGITVGVAVVAATIFFVTPQYKSTTKMYVLNQQSKETLTNNDMLSSLSLTKDYAEMIKSRTVTEGVISQLNLNMTDSQLLSKMSVKITDDTRILTITVTDPDPYMACQLANAIRDISANHIKNVMAIDAVNVVETANIPSGKSSPNPKRNGILGVIAGGAFAVIIILINYVVNDTISTQEDVEKYLKLSVLGTIPLSEKGKKNRKKKNKKRGRRR